MTLPCFKLNPLNLKGYHMNMKTLVLKDGRTLAYEDVGAISGVPIFFQHGTSDSRLCMNPDEDCLKELGIRLITTDRPGVGGSTFKKGRSLLDWADDIEQLADHLKVNNFIVAGHSGGGPHALAIAYKLGQRVSKIGLASPLAPFDEPGNKKLVKDKDLKLIFRLKHLKFLANEAGKVESRMYAKNIRKFVEHCAKVYPADHDLFLDEKLEPMFEAEFLEAFKTDSIGTLADFWAFDDWGFKLEDIKQPTIMLYGDADTILDPDSADHYRKRIPQLIGATWVGAGHYGLYDYARWKNFFRALVV
jgi:pimeloyl-ACP methyl ester carboxylesterase